jgi:hypothetical protein
VREIGVSAALLAVSMVGAYLSWNEDKNPAEQQDVVLLSASPSGLSSVSLSTRTQTISVSLETLGKERRPWFAITTKGGTRTFLGNDVAEKAMAEHFAPFKALRSLGDKLGQSALETTRLDQEKKRLTIVASAKSAEFRVGGRTRGDRDYYVQPLGKSEVFLVAAKILADLEMSENRYMQRALIESKLSDVERLEIQQGDATQALLQQNRLAQKDAYWARESAPETAVAPLKALAENAHRLSASEHLTKDDVLQGAEAVVTFGFQGENRKDLGRISIFRKKNGTLPEYYAKSTVLPVVARLQRGAGEQIEKGLADLAPRP